MLIMFLHFDFANVKHFRVDTVLLYRIVFRADDHVTYMTYFGRHFDRFRSQNKVSLLIECVFDETTQWMGHATPIAFLRHPVECLEMSSFLKHSKKASWPL